MGHPHHQDIYANQLEILFKATSNSIVVTLVVAAIFLTIEDGLVPLLTRCIWFFLLILVMVDRHIVAKRYREASPSPDHAGIWGKKFLIGISLSGLLWGVAGILFFPANSLSHQVFTILVLAGLAAGSLTVLAADYRAYMAYVVPTLTPVIISCLLQKDVIHLAFAILLGLLLFFLIQAAKRLNDSIITSLIYRYENKDLLKDLKAERIRLGSRLDRILNDFSTEIYIVDLESLTILQTNSGAARNLGYSMDELLWICLPDINPELSAERLAILLASWHEGDQTPVVVRGEHRRKNGSRYPIEARLQVSYKENPSVCVITVLDDTERHLY
jgi:PAS domain S-box-containing protein